MSRSRLKRLPFGFLAMLVMVVLIERGIERRKLEFIHSWAWSWQVSGRAARSLARGNDVICLGDSMMKYGVAPRVLGDALGVRAYNLASGAAPPPLSYFQLKRAYEAGARPRVAIVDFIPHLLQNSPRDWQELWPDYLDWREAIDLCRNARDAGFFGSIAVAKALPSLRYRNEIRARIAADFEGRATDRIATDLGFMTVWRDNRGADVLEKRTGPPADFTRYASDLYPDAWRPSELNVAYVRRLLDLAAEHGTTVVVLIPPFNDSVRRERVRKGLDAAYDSFLRNLQRDRAGVIVVDARSSGYGDAVHYDPIHLDREGATALSRALAQVIRPLLDRSPLADAPRWIAAPRFEPSAHPEPSPTRVADERPIQPGRDPKAPDPSTRK